MLSIPVYRKLQKNLGFFFHTIPEDSKNADNTFELLCYTNNLRLNPFSLMFIFLVVSVNSKKNTLSQV